MGTKASRPSYRCLHDRESTSSFGNTDLGEGLQGCAALAAWLLQPPFFAFDPMPSIPKDSLGRARPAAKIRGINGLSLESRQLPTQNPGNFLPNLTISWITAAVPEIGRAHV